MTVKSLSKDYDVAANVVFGGKKKGTVKANVDLNFDAKVGDTVRVMETKPISKMRRWRITEVIERAK